MAKVETFYDGQYVVVDVLSEKPSSTGLLILNHPEYGKFVRHIDRVDPMDEEAKQILKKESKLATE